MSDPLSLAAAGVGFVSLGLTVCDVIYEYANAQAGKSADMRQLREAADDLKSTVKLIEAGGYENGIENKIASCKAAATSILELAEKHEPAKATAHTFSERTKRLARAGLYPMRRENIMELQQACQRYSLNLVLLLQLFGVDGMDELRDVLVVKMDAMAATVSSEVLGLEQSFLAATSAEGTRVVQETRGVVLQSQDTLVRTVEAASSRTEATITSAGRKSVVAITEAGAQQSQRTQDLVLQRFDSAEARMLLSEQQIMSAVEAQSGVIGNRISQELDAGLASYRQHMDVMLRGSLESIRQDIASRQMQIMETLLLSRPAGIPGVVAMQGFKSRTTAQHISGPSGGALSSEISFPASSNGDMLTASGCRRPPTRERRATLANGLGPGSAQAVVRGCTCPAPVRVQVSQPRRYFGSFWLQSEESIVHHRDCCLWYLSRRRRTFQINFSAFGFAVYGPIEVENSPFFWLKRLHIDPKLSFRSVVPSNSPVFNAIEWSFEDAIYDLSSGDRDRKVMKALTFARILDSKLSELFQRGEASPTDVDPDGNNLFHRLCYAIKPYDSGEHREAFEIFASVLFNMGVPRSDANSHGQSPMTIILEDLRWSLSRGPWKSRPTCSGNAATLASFFYASDVLGNPETWCTGVAGIRLQNQLEWCARLTTSGRPLSIASTQGDVAKVRSILGTSPELLVTEKNMLDQTPLHLAVLQPAVLTLLLACPTSASIIDHKDCSGNSAMYYACELQSPQAVLMLSGSGASLEPALAFANNPHFMNIPGPALYQSIAEARRSRLEGLIRLGIAHDCASDAHLTQFPHPFELFNKVARALREKGVEIPVTISSAIPYLPFGHLAGLNAPLAESLWDQGLFLLDEEYDGTFPILYHLRYRGDTALLDWLWSRNPRLDIHTRVHGLDVAHIVAAGVGDQECVHIPHKLVRACLFYAPPISIKCFCMGATSIFMPFRRYGQNVFSLCDLLNLCHAVDLLEEQHFDFLRALTFGALQLTHTCPLLHNPHKWPYRKMQSAEEDRKWELPVMEAAEIQRINQEQDEPIIRFEKLLGELIGEYNESHLSFPQFLDLVWFPRMMDKVDLFGPRTADFLDGIRCFLNRCGLSSDDASDGEQSGEDQSAAGGDD